MTPKIDEGGGDPDGNYSTLFDNREMGLVFSQVHAAMIRAGTELERIVIKECASHCEVLDNLDYFLTARKNEQGTFVATKKVVKRSERIDVKASEPDFVIFVNNGEKHCYIIELKWGLNFDTKKSEGEISALREYRSRISTEIEYVTSAHICSITANSAEEIQRGFKNKIELKEAMTGELFCNLLGIERDKVIEKMREDAEYNRRYVVKKILEFNETKGMLKEDAEK